MTDPRKESSIGRGDRIVVMGVRDNSLSQFARELLRRVAGT
jgi:hypothetical protein